jgi:hypothetical protein
MELDDLSDLSLYCERLGDVMDDLLETYHSGQWDDLIQLKTPEEWCEAVARYTIPTLKELLNRPELPKLAELIALRLVDTQQAGRFPNDIPNTNTDLPRRFLARDNAAN